MLKVTAAYASSGHMVRENNFAGLEIVTLPPDMNCSQSAGECRARFKASRFHSLEIAEVALTLC